jgi:hypothetical protein
LRPSNTPKGNNMAVIINEFEVVAGPPPTTKPPGTSTDESQKQQKPSTAHDIHRVVRQRMHRLARVRAH